MIVRGQGGISASAGLGPRSLRIYLCTRSITDALAADDSAGSASLDFIRVLPDQSKVALSACSVYSPRTARPLHWARWWSAAWEAATLAAEPFQIFSAGAWSARPKEKLNLQGVLPARQMAFNR